MPAGISPRVSQELYNNYGHFRELVGERQDGKVLNRSEPVSFYLSNIYNQKFTDVPPWYYPWSGPTVAIAYLAAQGERGNKELIDKLWEIWTIYLDQSKSETTDIQPVWTPIMIKILRNSNDLENGRISSEDAQKKFKNDKDNQDLNLVIIDRPPTAQSQAMTAAEIDNLVLFLQSGPQEAEVSPEIKGGRAYEERLSSGSTFIVFNNPNVRGEITIRGNNFEYTRTVPGDTGGLNGTGMIQEVLRADLQNELKRNGQREGILRRQIDETPIKNEIPEEVRRALQEYDGLRNRDIQIYRTLMSVEEVRNGVGRAVISVTSQDDEPNRNLFHYRANLLQTLLMALRGTYNPSRLETSNSQDVSELGKLLNIPDEVLNRPRIQTELRREVLFGFLLSREEFEHFFEISGNSFVLRGAPIPVTQISRNNKTFIAQMMGDFIDDILRREMPPEGSTQRESAIEQAIATVNGHLQPGKEPQAAHALHGIDWGNVLPFVFIQLPEQNRNSVRHVGEEIEIDRKALGNPEAYPVIPTKTVNTPFGVMNIYLIAHDKRIFTFQIRPQGRDLPWFEMTIGKDDDRAPGKAKRIARRIINLSEFDSLVNVILQRIREPRVNAIPFEISNYLNMLRATALRDDDIGRDTAARGFQTTRDILTGSDLLRKIRGPEGESNAMIIHWQSEKGLNDSNMGKDLQRALTLLEKNNLGAVRQLVDYWGGLRRSAPRGLLPAQENIFRGLSDAYLNRLSEVAVNAIMDSRYDEVEHYISEVSAYQYSPATRNKVFNDLLGMYHMIKPEAADHLKSKMQVSETISSYSGRIAVPDDVFDHYSSCCEINK